MTTIEQAKQVEQRLRKCAVTEISPWDAADIIASLIAELESAQKDAARIKFLDSNKSMMLDWNRKRKWAYRATFTSYEFECFNTVREAIDAAMIERTASAAIAAEGTK